MNNTLFKNVKITGTGSYAPPKIYTNFDIEKMTETNDAWVKEMLGISERHVAGKDECTSDLAARAGIKAINNSGLSVEDIEMIIVATATPDRLAPSTAAIVQDKIKAYNSVCFDVSAVCSGFLYAMSIASQYISSGTYKNILVIGADTFSKITDWTRRDCVFFGDGAGAAVFSHNSKNSGLQNFRLFSDGRGKWNFTIPAGGSEIPASNKSLEEKLHYFKMNGREVYNTATRVLPKVINMVLKDLSLTIDDIDYMIPHQPSIKILEKTAEIIGLDRKKLMTNMDKYANTSGATIPILLDEVNKSGKLKKNKLILFAAVGSGWTYGASIFKWI